MIPGLDSTAPHAMSARTGSSGCRRYCTPTRPMWVRLHRDTASRRPHAGESAFLRQQAQALPSTPGRRAFSTARLVGWGRRRWAGHILLGHVPPFPPAPAGRAGAPCGYRPAARPAPRPGPASTGLPRREKGKREGTAAPDKDQYEFR